MGYTTVTTGPGGTVTTGPAGVSTSQSRGQVSVKTMFKLHSNLIRTLATCIRPL